MYPYWSVLWHLDRTERRLQSPCDQEVCIEAIESLRPRRRRILKLEQLLQSDNLPVSRAASNFWIIWAPRTFEQVHFKIVFMTHEHFHHSF